MRSRSISRGSAAFVAAVLATSIVVSPAAATDPIGTALTYQGRLTLGGTPVEGAVDLVFRLFDAPTDGILLSTLVADDFVVGAGGHFTIDLDFGDEFTGAARWIEIDIDGETLTPRQPIMATPYALVAKTAAFVPGKAMVGSYGGITGVGTLNALNVGGNVGIGTSAPISPLHIVANQAVARMVSSSSASGSVLVLQSNAATPTLYGAVNFQSDGGGTPGQIGYRATHDLTFRTNGVERMRITGAGRAGFGTIAPEARIHAIGISDESAIRGESASGTGISGVGFIGVAGTAASSSNGYGGSFSGAGFLGAGRSLISWGESHFLGRVGISTLEPELPLHVASGTDVNLSSGGYMMIGALNGANVTFDNNEIMARNNGNVAVLHLNADGGNVRIGQNNPTNRLITPILEITGGSDLSERFDVACLNDTPPSPGMVVCIDPANPGKLVQSTRAYDRTVAGIISGANGIRAGMVMGQEGSEADGSHPVALTGRVYVMADALDGAIEPGDLLTTSDVAGHAMKVSDHARAQGSIIGKAMTALAAGERGMVLVLVSLQ